MGMNEFSREENMQKMFEDRDNIEEEDEEEAKEDTIMEKAEAIINNHNDNNNSNHTEEKVECFTSFICLNLVKISSSKLNWMELRKISHQRTKQNIVRKIVTGVSDYLHSDYNQIEKK